MSTGIIIFYSQPRTLLISTAFFGPTAYCSHLLSSGDYNFTFFRQHSETSLQAADLEHKLKLQTFRPGKSFSGFAYRDLPQPSAQLLASSPSQVLKRPSAFSSFLTPPPKPQQLSVEVPMKDVTKQTDSKNIHLFTFKWKE